MIHSVMHWSPYDLFPFETFRSVINVGTTIKKAIMGNQRLESIIAFIFHGYLPLSVSGSSRSTIEGDRFCCSLPHSLSLSRLLVLV